MTTVSQLAAMLGITRPTVYKMVKDGRLSCASDGMVCWTDEEVSAILANRPAKKRAGRPKGAKA